VKTKIKNAIKQMSPIALAIVAVSIVLGTGAITLAQFTPVTYTDTQVTGETAQPSAPLPTNTSLSGSTTSDYVQIEKDSVNIVLEDSSAGSNVSLTEDTDYKVYYEDGKAELQSNPGGVSYDDTSDQVYIDYSYESESTATSTVGSGENALGTFGDFLVPLAVVAIAAIIFLLLGGMESAGKRTMA